MNDSAAPIAPVAAAGIGRRLASLCYEVLLLAAIVFVAGWSFLVFAGLLPPGLARPFLRLYLLAITAVYFIYCWTRNGQTLPMKTWHIRLVDRDGGAITVKTGATRYFFALAGIAIAGVAFWWALFDREGQFLHDRLAGTKIVRTAD